MPGPKTISDNESETFGTINKGGVLVTFKVLGWFPAANDARDVIEAAALSYIGPQRFFALDGLTGNYQSNYSTQLVSLRKDGSATYIIRANGTYLASVEFSVNNPDNVSTVNALLFFDPVFYSESKNSSYSE